MKINKIKNSYKGFIPYQSEFSHFHASWAKNHRGWAKMKRSNKRLAKHRELRIIRGFLVEESCLFFS